MNAPCDFCRWQLVNKTTESQVRRRGRGRAVRQFCCAVCGRYLETPVSRRHEIQWRAKPKPGPLEDQLTIYDDAR